MHACTISNSTSPYRTRPHTSLEVNYLKHTQKSFLSVFELPASPPGHERALEYKTRADLFSYHGALDIVNGKGW